jgi:phosphopantothenoylcysteine decarboxylase/phosphopantothenate--cysteine ligase
MNDGMFAHPQVQENLARLREKLGYTVAGPARGALAVGESGGQGEAGPGRMVEPAEIEEHVGRALGTEPAWTGRRVLVTAGPTREALDPVRYLGNRSSGRMGYALAQAAWRRGAEVSLVSGPSELTGPVGVDLIRVETAAQMRDAVAERIGRADVTVFAAAVADYRPAEARSQKVKREVAGESLAVALEANPDIAQATRDARKPGSLSIGFALETSDLVANATKKLASKGFDLIVANDATEEGAGFEVATNRVTILAEGREPEALPLLSKDEVAEEVLDRASALLARRRDEARG